MQELENNDKYKFLNDIYDDFFYLISSNPDDFKPEKTNMENKIEVVPNSNIEKELTIQNSEETLVLEDKNKNSGTSFHAGTNF